LLALAKRQPKIATFIDAELNTIATQQKATIEAIDDHKKKDIEKKKDIFKYIEEDIIKNT
jgi:hypothetical protein